MEAQRMLVAVSDILLFDLDSNPGFGQKTAL